MGVVKIAGQTRATEFEGELIHAVTTYRDDKDRWFEMKLYKREPSGWVVDRVSMSLIYHVLDGPCERANGEKKGSPCKVADLDPDAEPCSVCHPPYPEHLRADAEVRFEFPRHTVIHCKTAVDVVRNVTTDRRTGTQFTSAPATELLTEAAKISPEIESALLAADGVSYKIE